MTDRLTLTRALEGSGMASDAAERIATEIYDAIHDNVATKSDLREMELRLEAKIDRVVIRLGSMIVVATGVLIAIKYFG
jgi:hypothetical protein